MKRKNTTRHALFTSAVSLLLCVSMFVGTTFAWFTDTVTSGVNTIAAGNLDVELYHSKANDFTNPVKVSEDTKLFTDVNGNEIKHWEPGVVAFTNLQVANVGTLALKYQLSVNSTEMNYYTDADGVQHTLAEALKVAVIVGGVAGTTREDVIAAADAIEDGWTALESFTLSGELEGNTTSMTYGIAVYWEPDENDNLFNMNNGKTTSDGEALNITLGVNLFATQEMYENDSFGDDYDKLAPWVGQANSKWYDATQTEFTITSAEELAGLAQIVNNGTDTFTGKTVTLAANIDLNDAPWTPIGTYSSSFDGTFIGTGYTISNLYVVGESGLGLFGYTGTSAHIEGVTIDGAEVRGTDYVGAVLGSGYLSANCIKNCTVKNAEIYATPFQMADGTYDGGAKAGAIVGYARNGNISGCKAINCTVSAFRDLGGIAGMVSGEDRAVEVSGNTVDTVTLAYVNMKDAVMHEGKVNENMGDVAGRLLNASVTDDNVATNVKRETLVSYTVDGVEYRKNVDANTILLFKVTEEASEVLTIPEGVTHLRNKVLNGNTTVKEVVIPSTVVDFGGTPNDTGTGATGGMFYKSAVEKITLTEGLTEIPAAAFNQAANLTSVNIPVSVKKIGINAFAGTGLETLTVPATVTEIGYGAFRDMLDLTAVTIEGDVYIPDFAFRACKSLKSVYLRGENVTFGSNMIFTITSTNNENPNGITVYVANETVKASLEATKQFKGTIAVTAFVSDDTELAVAINKGQKNIVLSSGDYTLRFTQDATFNLDNTTLIGMDRVNLSVSSTEVWYGQIRGTGVMFENINFTSGTVGATGKATYNNCTFAGALEFASSNSAETYVKDCVITGNVHTSGDMSAGDAFIINSKVGKAEYGSSATVTFEGCEIGEIIIWSGDTVLNNCTYNSLENKGTGAVTIDGDSVANITPDNWSSTTIKSNRTYYLSGDFADANVSLVMAVDVENVVFDGTNATNINELIITQNGALIDNATSFTGDRSGKVTIKNFTIASQINVFATKTEVEICNNTAEALSVYAGNCKINIHDNAFDANFETHSIYRDATNVWASNDYGVQLRIFDYELYFDNNTVTDAVGHVVAINGYEATFADIEANNVIKSFTGNKITVNSTTKTARAAFKVWADHVYAPQDNQDTVNDAAQAFINAVLADNSNTFNIFAGYNHTIFSIYNVNTNS